MPVIDYPIFHFAPGVPNPYAPPPQFWEVQRTPAALFAQGSPRALALLHRLPEDGFAIVGTRDPQQRAIAHVRRVVRELADSGLIIVSGFARGIDAAAHEAALEAGLPTIAIVAGGPNLPYPRENLPLRQRILDSGGLVISEHPPDTQPFPADFIERNRLIAWTCKATWVAQAGLVSGAISTAKKALTYEREVYVTPSFPEDAAFAGTQKLVTGAKEGELVLPLFQRSDLARTWPRLRKPLRPSCRVIPLRGTPADMLDQGRLASEVRRLTTDQGSADVQELLDWGTGQGWSPQQFFLALRLAVLEGLVSDRGGLLSAE